MKSTLLRYFSITAVTLLLSACAQPKNTAADVGFINVRTLPDLNPNINPIRLQALRETASTLGAQGALAWRAAHIDQSLAIQTTYLDQVFNFNQLLLPHNVLPPVLVEANKELNLADNDTIRMADKIYKIILQARFATTPPTWRDYLWMAYKKPAVPDRTLLPQSRAEASLWNYYLKQGWQQGLQQANDIFMANLSYLKRDYLGMILYRKLLAQGMITAPEVAKANLGITGNDKELRINDAIMRITAQAQLQPDGSKWQAVLTQQ